MRWRFFVSEAMRSIRGNVATTVAASVTVLIVTFLLAVFASLGLFLYDKTVGVRNDLTVKVYMKRGTEADSATLNRIRNELATMPYVKTVTYISPEKAITLLDKEAQNNLKYLPRNPLPPAFYVKLTDPGKASEVAAGAGQLDGVRDCASNPCVTYGKEIADRVLTVTKWVLVVLGALMAMLGVAAVVLIANTIRLSIFSRRREIEVMKLVGATNWFVRVPFVLEGMLTGFAGAAGAVALLTGVYIALSNLNNGLTDPATGFPGGVTGLGLALVSFGTFLGAVGSGMTLRKFLRI
ncbi:MAG: cell division transport system permease protein [Gaiellales bacterium]|nr:cell division transport system permease protein [Gaiellales bacterium]